MMKYPIVYACSMLTMLSVSARGQEKSDSIPKADPVKIDRLENPRWREEQMTRHGATTEITIQSPAEEEAGPVKYRYRLFRCRSSVSWDVVFPRKRLGRITHRGGHWAGFGLGYAGLIERFGRFSLPDDARFMSQDPRSVAVMINPVDYALIRGRTTALITGIGFEFNNFRFDRNLTLTQENGRIAPDPTFDQAGIRLRKSKLVTGYLNVPLLFEVQFGEDTRAFVNFGVVGGLRICGHTKIKLNAPGYLRRIKRSNGLNLTNFHYGIAMHGGYRNWALTAHYYPHSIFRRDEGPDVQQINIGVAFML